MAKKSKTSTRKPSVKKRASKKKADASGSSAKAKNPSVHAKQDKGQAGGGISSGPSAQSSAVMANLDELGPDASIDSSAWIHPGASVIGNVIMGPECSVWPGSVLRADLGHIELGRAVNIQDGTVIHCDSRGRVTIGDYTLVGHRAMLHGCTVGRGVLVGIDCVILDGAEIGDGAMITAGCMIRGGMKIPAGSMVVQKGGELKIYPGKARTRMTIAGSLEYVELARRWKGRIFSPPTVEEERELFERAGIILKEMFSE